MPKDLAGLLRGYVDAPWPDAAAETADPDWADLPRPPPPKAVPTFWTPLQNSPDYYPPCERLQDEAKRRHLRRQSQEMLNAERLWVLLQEHATAAEPDADGSALDASTASSATCGLRLTYPDFRAVNAALLRETGATIPPADFLVFERDAGGAIPAIPFFAYLCKKVVAVQTRVLLEQRDAVGDGHLTEPDLEEFARQLIPTLRGIRKISPSYHPYYLCHATRKFFFFLDAGRRGRLHVDRLLGSDILQELIRLRTGSDAEADEELDDMGCNWFTLPIFHRVFAHFKQLDQGGKGTLSREDLYGYNDHSFTRVFIDRVVDVTSIGGVIDYRRFLDFVLATEFVQQRASWQYYWRMFDAGAAGHITPATLRALLTEIMAKLREHGLPEVGVDDAVAEVVDMINPADPHRITLADIERSGHPHLVLAILVDFKAWHQYDSRENMLASSAPR